MSKLYVVVDIGCLECHNPSALVGVFTDQDQALATGAFAPEALSTEGMDWPSWSTDQRGGPLRVVFETEAPA